MDKGRNREINYLRKIRRNRDIKVIKKKKLIHLAWNHILFPENKQKKKLRALLLHKCKVHKHFKKSPKFAFFFSFLFFLFFSFEKYMRPFKLLIYCQCTPKLSIIPMSSLNYQKLSMSPLKLTKRQK
jgi:hypothetical protein